MSVIMNKLGKQDKSGKLSILGKNNWKWESELRKLRQTLTIPEVGKRTQLILETKTIRNKKIIKPWSQIPLKK